MITAAPQFIDQRTAAFCSYSNRSFRRDYSVKVIPEPTLQFGPPQNYVSPADKLNGLAEEIGRERDRKLEAARQQRAAKCRQTQTASQLVA